MYTQHDLLWMKSPSWLLNLSSSSTDPRSAPFNFMIKDSLLIAYRKILPEDVTTAMLHNKQHAVGDISHGIYFPTTNLFNSFYLVQYGCMVYVKCSASYLEVMVGLSVTTVPNSSESSFFGWLFLLVIQTKIPTSETGNYFLQLLLFMASSA